MRPSTASKRPARAAAFKQDGQSALMLLELPVTAVYLPLQSAAAGRLCSQLSSAVSSAFPSARFLWQARMHAAAFPRLFPTESSHFAAFLSGGMKPVSSPPNGVPAIARPMASAATRPPTRIHAFAVIIRCPPYSACLASPLAPIPAVSLAITTNPDERG